MKPQDLLIDDETIDKAKEKGKTLVPWLPDPKRCESCKSYCDADYQYVESQAEYTRVWQCPNDECEKRYFRERI